MIIENWHQTIKYLELKVTWQRIRKWKLFGALLGTVNCTAIKIWKILGGVFVLVIIVCTNASNILEILKFEKYELLSNQTMKRRIS